MYAAFQLCYDSYGPQDTPCEDWLNKLCTPLFFFAQALSLLSTNRGGSFPRSNFRLSKNPRWAYMEGTQNWVLSFEDDN